MDALVDALKMDGSLFSSDEADELIDALRNGDFTVKGVLVVEEGDEDYPCHDYYGACNCERRKQFMRLLDGLACQILTDDEEANRVFIMWSDCKAKLDKSYDDEDFTEERRDAIRGGMKSWERIFKNIMFDKHHDLIHPMGLTNKDVNDVIRERFIKNYAMVEKSYDDGALNRG